MLVLKFFVLSVKHVSEMGVLVMLVGLHFGRHILKTDGTQRGCETRGPSPEACCRPLPLGLASTASW